MTETRAVRRCGRRVFLCGLNALPLGGCQMPEGRSDAGAIAGFRPSGGEITVTGPVAWLTDDGEIMLSVDGRPTPVSRASFASPHDRAKS